ncbi:MAG: hypothetical protein GX606_00805 [Elusimicrobia bacterium]|nr:hypothetical protein [Elusimicrobiota bacterium]
MWCPLIPVFGIFLFAAFGGLVLFCLFVVPFLIIARLDRIIKLLEKKDGGRDGGAV